ncbi:MAG: AbrB/MazE/SpoVT family DNA-binding domain-containing protein [Oceanicaulis sp.]
MKALIGKWGRSVAVRLPAAYLDALGMRPGDEVELKLEQGAIRMTPKARPTLEQLVEEMKGQEPPELVDWGPDVGAEIIRD